jgi:hypothetical protein
MFQSVRGVGNVKQQVDEYGVFYFFLNTVQQQSGQGSLQNK